MIYRLDRILFIWLTALIDSISILKGPSFLWAIRNSNRWILEGINSLCVSSIWPPQVSKNFLNGSFEKSFLKKKPFYHNSSPFSWFNNKRVLIKVFRNQTIWLYICNINTTILAKTLANIFSINFTARTLNSSESKSCKS